VASPARKDSPLEILDLRHFTSYDMQPLLQEEVQVWAKLLAWDYRSSSEMILRYLDAKILPGYAAVQANGKVCGYAFFVYEGGKGVVGDLFVREVRDRGPEREVVEERLLTNVIETLQHSPGVHRVEAQLLAHDTGTAVAPFEAHQFSTHPRLFMMLRLQPKAPEATPLAPGIEIRRWSENDYQGVSQLITTAYSNHIDAKINDQYRTPSGSLRFLNNIVRFPGCGIFDNHSSFVAVHRPSRTIVGVILCSRVKDRVGHVTQVCLLPEFRGRRIGEALLNSSAIELARRGFTDLTLTVTEANRGAVQLYRKLGYRVERVFDAFVWEG
jgi:ribosomal protein S18 acetylase RimI-like enzyme